MGIVTGSLIGLATLSLGYLGFTATQVQETAKTPDLGTKVTASMTNASMDEVLNWLRRTGVNFVIDKNTAPKDVRLNLNIVDKPLRDAMDAIASAIGGSWQKHGEIYSLRQGMAFGLPSPFPGEGFAVTPPPNMDELRSFKSEIAPQIEEGLKNFKYEIDPKRLEELNGLEFELPDFEGFVMPPMPEGVEGLKLRMLDQGQIKELITSLTSKQKDTMKSRGHLTMDDLTAKQREIVESMGGIQGTIRLKTDEGEVTLKGPNSESPMTDVIIAPGMPAPGVLPMPREGVAPPAPKAELATPVPPAVNRWKELSASLTPVQKNLMKKQGFLYEDQLTASQRRMVSLPQDSTFTLTVSNGKESITIKSRKQ
jgi:hypothetical protein